ncbi:MAG TPA: rhodanese-like domain-containing protein [Candidatus Salinicoccus stercoripullorum]|uniref:Rhodanese-like domain-containing protein n=1 Tax=Candidatus Salinicoccus stercoripullorum TaxID=2838756 RepID=A0A9D1TYX5_9STAP|nr:rhodanese-like domain-containing protein [Candidatus Salinicoccus stercoripullorum]
MAETVDISKVGDAVRDEGNVLIDVRETPELEETGFIPGAVHYPMSNFESTIASLDKDKKYYVICRSGKRSESVQNQLLDNGYEAVNVLGGMSAYEGPVNHI